MDQERDELLETWLREYGTSILRTCFVCLSDMRDAEDALQETFLKAWRAMDRYERRNGASEKTWLTHIAINVCRDMRRTRWFRHVDRAVEIENLPLPVSPPSAEHIALTQAIMRLKGKYREVVLLHCDQGLTVRDTAKALGIAAPAVINRLKKARAALAEALGEGDA